MNKPPKGVKRLMKGTKPTKGPAMKPGKKGKAKKAPRPSGMIAKAMALPDDGDADDDVGDHEYR